MKNYQSTVENVWLELTQITLNNDEITLLKSNNVEDLEDKKDLIQSIKLKSQTEVSLDVKATLNGFYNNIKPKLNNGDNYEFISINLIDSGNNNFTGILNCRVNKEHKQIRF